MEWVLLAINIVYFVLKILKLLYIHLFGMRKFVDDFWKDLSDWLSIKLCHDFNLENRHKLFGIEDCNGIFQLVNGLLLYARFLIYRCKYSKSIPNMAQCYSLHNSVKKSEYIIAKKLNKMALHFALNEVFDIVFSLCVVFVFLVLLSQNKQ